MTRRDENIMMEWIDIDGAKVEGEFREGGTELHLFGNIVSLVLTRSGRNGIFRSPRVVGQRRVDARHHARGQAPQNLGVTPKKGWWS